MLLRQQTVSLDLDIMPSVMLMGKGPIGIGPVDRYNLPDVWCLHLYSGDGEVDIDGVTYPIRPGYVSVMPPGVDNVYRARRKFDALYVHFTVPQVIGARRIKVMQDAADRFDRLQAQLEEAIAYRGTIPVRSEVIVWNMLWELALADQHPPQMLTDIPGAGAGKPHFLVRALQIIEFQLSERLTVESLATELEVSHSTLTRAFKAVTGDTVIGYILKRRVERARLLLIHSPRTIGTIARDVGIPNMQQFNKTIRRILGVSPSEIRASGRYMTTNVSEYEK